MAERKGRGDADARGRLPLRMPFLHRPRASVVGSRVMVGGRFSSWELKRPLRNAACIKCYLCFVPTLTLVFK